MKNSDPVDLFCSLVEIPSPSGQERDVGLFIKNFLQRMGISSAFDETGKKNKSNTGNLIGVLKGTPGQPTIAFIAHMDTVENGEEHIVPVIRNGIIRSSGKTILGADNKASIACVLSAIQKIQSWSTRPTILLVFSTREEKGEMGVSFLELPKNVDYIFTCDGAGPVGTFVYKCLGQIPFDLTVFGKAAHASLAPEKGIHAIRVAAHAISRLRMGRKRNGETLNIGAIAGGSATNIIPDRVVTSGEVRGFTHAGMQRQIARIKAAAQSACQTIGGSYRLSLHHENGVPPMCVSKRHPIVDLARRATAASGLTCSLDSGFFACEANVIAARGYPVLTLCRGGRNAHSSDESIATEELQKLQGLLVSVVKEAVISSPRLHPGHVPVGFSLRSSHLTPVPVDARGGRGGVLSSP